jgi:membrane protein YdbS with pleckstrin-like domain
VLCVREGAFSTAEHVTFTDKVQSVVVDESPFDRRHRHASLSVDTAGAFLRQGHDVAIRYLPRSDAFALRDELVGAAARARFRW